MDIIDYIYKNKTYKNTLGFDRERARLTALKKVLPLIIENELTERQKICLKYMYISGKSQSEIASELKLSQPTVSRHINTAKNIVNSELKYCYFAVSTALESYDG